MRSKYIFLDIDGVLCIDEHDNEESVFPYPFTVDCVKVLNKILLATDAEIILTSDWRIHFDYDLKAIGKEFKRNKVIKSPIDTTPDYNGQRSKEIFTYVYNHSYIKSFLILDDMNLKCCSMRFLRTKKDIGLTEPGIKDNAIYILNELDHSHVHTCINCDTEFVIGNDNYTCSTNCRSEIEKLKSTYKTPPTDEIINDFVLNNKIKIYN